MSWVKGNLLNLREVVPDVLIQDELSNLSKRELVLRPNMCQVKDVDTLLLPNFLGLLSGHGLNLNIPAREITLLNRTVKILCRVVRAVVCGVFLGDETGALLRLEMQLHIDPVSILVNKLVRMADITVHLAISVGYTSVTEEDQELMY
jgi:hypothetical protein